MRWIDPSAISIAARKISPVDQFPFVVAKSCTLRQRIVLFHTLKEAREGGRKEGEKEGGKEGRKEGRREGRREGEREGETEGARKRDTQRY